MKKCKAITVAVKAAETSAAGKSIYRYANNSPAAKAIFSD